MTTTVPVLIVGGGMSGLTTSLQLAHHGVESIVIERHPSTSHLPKAHTLNPRSMEVFRQIGIVDDMLQVAVPPKHIQKASWRSSFGGDAPYDRQILVSLDTFGGGDLTQQYLEASPQPYSSFHQVRLEPFLSAKAEQNPLIDIRFNTEAVSYEETDGECITVIRNCETGEEETVRSQYVVAADGGKFFQERLGYEMVGLKNVGDNITLWFKADLSEWMDDETLLTWFVTPSAFGMVSGVLVPVGAGRNSDEWVLHFGYPPGEGDKVTEEEALQRMRDLFKIPDFEFELIKLSRWFNESVVSNRFRTGRVISTGDAIHRHVPTLGIGMNSAIGDSNNLSWKLAHVVKGYAPDSLLDTFEEDRRPVVERNAELALQTYYLHVGVAPQLGMVPGAPAEWNEFALARYVEDSPRGRDRRARAHQLIWGDQRLEHQALDLEIGYHYTGSGVDVDEEDPHVPDPMLNAYAPSTRPGARLPHVWLKDRNGLRHSTLDLVGLGYTLVVSAENSAWKRAAEAIAGEIAAPLDVVVIDEATFRSGSDDWERIAGLGSKGALLVRPDQHIAWRALDAEGDLEARLRDAVATASRSAGAK